MRLRPRLLIALVAATVAAPLSPSPAAAAVPAPGTSVATLQVVGKLAMTPARHRAGVDAWEECGSLARAFTATARSGAAYGPESRTTTRRERQTVEVPHDGVPVPVELDVDVVTCTVRLHGPVSAAVAQSDLAAARARLPEWGLALRPDRAHGVVLALRLPRVSSHTLLGTLLNRVGPSLGPQVAGCAGGDVRRYAALGVVTSEPITAAALARARAATARAAGVPVRAVRVASPWGPSPYTCLDPVRQRR